jgi:hypothetical protein
MCELLEVFYLFFILLAEHFCRGSCFESSFSEIFLNSSEFASSVFCNSASTGHVKRILFAICANGI